MVSKGTYSNFDYGLIVLLLFLIGLGPAIHYFIPIKAIGVSFFITLLPFSLLSFLYLKNLNLFGDKNFLLILLSILIVILLGRKVLYGEDFLKLVASSFYFVYIPFLFSIFKKFEFTSRRRHYILRVILTVFVFHAINSVFFLLGLPHIANSDELADDFVASSRFAGIMGGANVQANFTAILFIVYLYGSKNMSVLKITFFAVLALIGVLPTVSRGGLLIILLNVVNKYYKLLVKGGIKVKLIIGIVVVLFGQIIVNIQFGTINDFFESYQERTETDDFSNGRIERIFFTYDRITENNVGVFIGIPAIRQTESKEFSISDNSGTLVLANTGFIFLVLFFGYIIHNFNRKLIYSSSASVYIITLIFTAFTNNAFLYFQWCTFAICGYYLIVSANKVFEEDPQTTI